MYITRVTLDNVRGFEHLDFDFDRGDGQYAGWTVFTGGNGAGKSTLLRAIALVLRVDSIEDGIFIHDDENKKDITIGLDIISNKNDDFFGEKIEGGIIEGGGYWHIRFIAQHKRYPFRISNLKWKDKNDQYKNDIKYIFSGSKGIFACGYGPFRRISGAAPDVAAQMKAPIAERFVTLFQESASLAEADVWLRDLRFKALEKREGAAEQLAQVIELLKDDLLPDGMVIDRVDSDGLWLKDQAGTELSWRGMSDGYRTVLALLIDILRHMIKTYGLAGLMERNDQGRLVVIRSGVVLIDEVDAHLHPEWQRNIGFWLKSRFPRIQFLVTSHSPFICQAADPNGLFVLPPPGSGEAAQAIDPEEYRKIIAARTDAILLSDAFGLEHTRSPEAVAARRDYARLKAKQRAGIALSADEQQHFAAVSPFVGQDEEG